MENESVYNAAPILYIQHATPVALRAFQQTSYSDCCRSLLLNPLLEVWIDYFHRQAFTISLAA